MKRFAFTEAVNGYLLRGVDDWLCFFQDSNGRWVCFWTECDPLWAALPRDLQRYATGLGRDTGNPDTPKHRKAAAEAIALIGLRKLQLGHQPDVCEFAEDCEKHFGAPRQVA